MELMNERFSKFLMGDAVFGRGKGVSSALALSNSITNMSGIYTGIQCPHMYKIIKHSFWSYYLETSFNFGCFTEFVKCSFHFQIVMGIRALGCRVQEIAMVILCDWLRGRICAISPTLNGWQPDGGSFENIQGDGIWCEDRSMANSSKERGNQQRQKHKWWLPTPKTPHGGLSDNTRKFMLNQRIVMKPLLKEMKMI